MKYLLILLLLVTVSSYVQSQVLSGPMVGHCAMREVSIWIQTALPSDVVMEYNSESAPQKKLRSQTVRTNSENFCTATLIANQVEPGTKYQYTIIINGKKVNFTYPTFFQTPPLWQWRTAPPDFSVALGSCTYINQPEYDRPGKGYGSEYEIFNSIYQKKPNLMLWLGDNVYLREADWDSRTGIFKRYTHTRSIPEMQQLLASVSNYAIWDDHDFGPNDSDRGFIHKAQTFDAFKQFWANPNYGFDGKGCITSTFEWGDVQFFLLDNRSFRSPNNRKTTKKAILGDEQIEWLIDNLASSKARFKIIAIGGQTLSSAALYENLATCPEERNKLIDAVKNENISGVFFLSGDRHFTELSKLERNGLYPLYDLTCSALTSGANTKALNEKNENRVEGTVVMQHNFAVLGFSGIEKERKMTITVYSSKGEILWQRVIKATEIE